MPEADLARQRELVDAFHAAAHANDFDSLVAALDPDVVLQGDRQGVSKITRGGAALAEQVSGRAQAAQSVLVNGSVGVIAAD
ncbi:hypothetical protein [Paenibacillus sp. FSL H7-0331]|uniref:hypothetical protein n=1 Tax=Paenibacillus sp. FSL H7-0331 TaxID=1920421 RepID=UPI00096E7B6B|nr:hypothetical protein [Paenibacillus sp. FSL H7-0331]OMF11332.1 hypothetical protein BK127_25350 [Paenibacillus sp. FSL H7-0331]